MAGGLDFEHQPFPSKLVFYLPRKQGRDSLLNKWESPSRYPNSPLQLPTPEIQKNPTHHSLYNEVSTPFPPFAAYGLITLIPFSNLAKVIPYPLCLHQLFVIFTAVLIFRPFSCHPASSFISSSEISILSSASASTLLPFSFLGRRSKNLRYTSCLASGVRLLKRRYRLTRLRKAESIVL